MNVYNIKKDIIEISCIIELKPPIFYRWFFIMYFFMKNKNIIIITITISIFIEKSLKLNIIVSPLF